MYIHNVHYMYTVYTCIYTFYSSLCSVSQYIVLVVVLIALEIAAGILGFIYRDQFVSKVLVHCIRIYTCILYVPVIMIVCDRPCEKVPKVGKVCVYLDSSHTILHVL